MSSLLETTYPLPRKISEILLLTRILEISQGVIEQLLPSTHQLSRSKTNHQHTDVSPTTFKLVKIFFVYKNEGG